MNARAQLTILATLCVTPFAAAGQATPAATDGAVRMFLDCSSFFCDLDFYRREIAFVDYVRDRQDADVHVLISRQASGGGWEYTLSFIGGGNFAGVDGSLSYSASATDTDDETRRGLARRVKFGLMEFVAASPIADRINIDYEAQQAGAPTTPTDDSWDFWVFTLSANGFANGESRQSFLNVFGSLAANRTTDIWKLNLRVNGSFNENRFELSDGSEVVKTNESYGGSGLLVRSITDHWSMGARTSINSATFTNTNLRFRFNPAIEYNIFPYSQSSRRFLSVLYAVGLNAVDYREETLFDKTGETLWEHSLTTSLQLTQPWGTSFFELEGSQFLSDPDKYSIELSGNGDVRLVRGLSLRIGGSISRVRDQLHLPKGDATDEDVLLRIQQLETSYRYFVSFGFSYRFGSIFNNVVNPRFGRRALFF